MPGFLRSLRPRSRASFRERPIAEDDTSNHSHESTPNSETSTGGASTPSSSLQSSVSTTSIPKLTHAVSSPSIPQRPSPVPASSSDMWKRRSVTGLSVGPPVDSTTPSPKLPTGKYAPVVENVTDNSWVHNKIFMIRGRCGDGTQRALDGTITVTHLYDSFPQTTWPVSEAHFKALVHLSPGPNVVRIEFWSQKLLDNNGSTSHHLKEIKINYLAPNSSPPLRLGMLVAKDSPVVYDTTPERKEREGNSWEMATSKFRMAAQLWQAFTVEHMFRGGFDRRCFRLEEDWTAGTSSIRDRHIPTMRSEPKVHLIRTDRTVAELRALAAQPNGNELMLGLAVEVLRNEFRPYPHQKEHVAMVIMDTHWDSSQRLLSGHVAAAGGDENIRVALYGSQALHAYPSCIEEVVPAFEDCTRTNLDYVANTNGTSGTSWEAATTSLWGHLREVGRIFGCTPQASGVMCDTSAPLFSRTFMTREPFSTTNNRQGLKPVTTVNETGWNKLDLMRFRVHPCFKSLSVRDPPITGDDEVQVWPINDKRMILQASKNGIAFIEIFAGTDTFATAHIGFLTAQGPETQGGRTPPFMPREYVINEQDLRDKLPKNRQKESLRFVVHSVGGSKAEVANVQKLLDRKTCELKISEGKGVAFRGPKLGSATHVGKMEELVLHCAVDTRKLLQSVKVYFDDDNVYGLQFFYEGYHDQLFGHSGEGTNPNGVKCEEFLFDTRRTEVLYGFILRVNTHLEGIQILTSQSRRSPWFGNPYSGTGHQLCAPRGFSLAGVSGSVSSYIETISILVKR